MNETSNFCPLKFYQKLSTDYFRITQSVNPYVGFFVQSSDLYMSSKQYFFIQILMDITFKYVAVFVVAKTGVKFRESTRQIPKSRSTFTKNAIFDVFWFPVHKRFSAVLYGLCWEYWDASKMVSLVMIGAMQTFCRWVKVKFFLKIGQFWRSPNRSRIYPSWWDWDFNSGL